MKQNGELNPQVSDGALSLLRDCVQGTTGESLLIVTEPKGTGYYDEDAPVLALGAARAMGMDVETIESPLLDGADLGAGVLDVMRGYDHVIFFSRVGDQLRFSSLKDAPSTTMCYTLDREMLESNFGAACYHGLCEVKELLDDTVSNCREVRVTCPRGTDYSGIPSPLAETWVDASMKRFPMLVPRPVPAEGFSGRIALGEFVVGTGAHHYSPYSMFFDNEVFAVVEDNRIIRFEGDEVEIARVNTHYEHVAGRFGIDPWFVHSWHAGIHPGCGYSTSLRQEIERWSGCAFGNPRLLHFHTCGGTAPGEISWNIVDPTIYVDGIAIWDKGRLHPERLPGGEALMGAHPKLRKSFLNPRLDIGMDS